MDWGFLVGATASVGSSGLFAFWSWMNLEAPVFKAVTHLLTASAAKEFPLQHIKSPVELLWSNHTQSYRPGYQIGQLQACGVGLLAGKDDVKGQGFAQLVGPVADAPKLQLQVFVFLVTATLHHDVGQGVVLVLLLHQFIERFQAKTQCQVIRIAAHAVFVTQLAFQRLS